SGSSAGGRKSNSPTACATRSTGIKTISSGSKRSPPPIISITTSANTGIGWRREQGVAKARPIDFLCGTTHHGQRTTTMTKRGVILAGGKGTRLGELTKVTNKHLLPVGPFPMVYHPLKKMVGAGLDEVLLVSGTEHMGDFIELFGSGKDYN